MSDASSTDFSREWHHALRMLRRRGWTILLFLAVTVGVVVVGTWMQTPIYQATSTVLIDMETPNVLAVYSIVSSHCPPSIRSATL